ncbi:MAG: hypothetical protein KAI14_02625, partial [Dehalococcoidales bacterium]|nr:hypothetical protein [Dehalococcoidales bacterium]
KPDLGNANFCSAGQLSPLLNDPFYKTVGIGTKIFLGGGIGYVAWQGTQHFPTTLRGENGVPKRPAGTLAVIGDLKQMKPQWLRGLSMLGYGSTITIGLGLPIPILSEEILGYTAVSDADILAAVVDYSDAYPQRKPDVLGEVSYSQLKSGSITVNGKNVPTAGLSSYSKALEIANQLKDWIEAGEFLLTEPVASIPGVESGLSFKPLVERSIE